MALRNRHRKRKGSLQSVKEQKKNSRMVVRWGRGKGGGGQTERERIHTLRLADNEISTYWSICRCAFTTPLLFPRQSETSFRLLCSHNQDSVSKFVDTR